MNIQITTRGSEYEAVVTPTEHVPVRWTSNGPMHGRELISELLALGLHQQDIVDAFAAADLDFVTKLNRGEFNAL